MASLMSHLYIFDLDGTLIQSFLDEVECPMCRGEKVLYAPSYPDLAVRRAPCPTCRGTGKKLVQRDQAYDDIIWLPDRRRVVQQLHTRGHRIAIATNQTGVSLGYQSQERVERKLAAVCRTLTKDTEWCDAGRPIRAYVEYDHRNTTRRKPAPGMLLEAMEHNAAAPWETTYVGDLPVDQLAAQAAGVAFAWADDFFRIAVVEPGTVAAASPTP